jgi:uncharacterized protein YndB with AHSA1/START domain
MILNNAITVNIVVDASLEKAWHYWTNPLEILKWNQPTDEWHTTKAEVDFQPGGQFLYRMERKDGTDGFDYAGIYDFIIPLERIEYTGTDGRRTFITFDLLETKTVITETFESDESLPLEMQREFCTGVLENFKKLVEE